MSNEKEERGRRIRDMVSLALLLVIGIGMMVYTIVTQDAEVRQDMEEYQVLVNQVQTQPDEQHFPAESAASPTEKPTMAAPEQTVSNDEQPDTHDTQSPDQSFAEDPPLIEPTASLEQSPGGQEDHRASAFPAVTVTAVTTHVPGTNKQPTLPEKQKISSADEADPTASPAPVIGKTGVDLSACTLTNGDFVAWLKIPGTKINYPVVWSDDVDYYLTHTFAGKESKIGTLFSLGKTDYRSPGKNIAVYGHHITTSGGNMFQPLISYKKQSYYADHKTIYFDTLYHFGEYTIFAVINMTNGDWDASAAAFAGDQDFLAFVQRAKALSLYDTGIEVNAEDHILTLITCDRSYNNKDGRLVVMAVEQSIQ